MDGEVKEKDFPSFVKEQEMFIKVKSFKNTKWQYTGWVNEVQNFKEFQSDTKLRVKNNLKIQLGKCRTCTITNLWYRFDKSFGKITHLSLFYILPEIMSTFFLVFKLP